METCTEIEAYYRGVEDALKELIRRFEESGVDVECAYNPVWKVEELLEEMIGETND